MERLIETFQNYFKKDYHLFGSPFFYDYICKKEIRYETNGTRRSSKKNH